MCREISGFIKIGQEQSAPYMKQTDILYTVLVISRSVIRGLKNVSDKSCTETLKTHILCSISFFSSENLAVYEKMWENTVEQGRPQMTIWRMRIACWIPKATNAHSCCVILIAFRQ